MYLVDNIWDRVQEMGTSHNRETIIMASIYWSIWKEKNNMIFRDVGPNIYQCIISTYIDIIYRLDLSRRKAHPTLAFGSRFPTLASLPLPQLMDANPDAAITEITIPE